MNRRAFLRFPDPGRHLTLSPEFLDRFTAAHIFRRARFGATASETASAVGRSAHDIDFRSVYATVLSDWFGLDPATVGDVLGGDFGNLGFIADPTTIDTSTEELPSAPTLEQNYPNPFNPETVIAFSLPRPGAVRLNVYDVNGRLVRRLVEGVRTAGRHEVRFDGSRLSSGTYIYRLETPAGSRTGAMILAR